ncbi:MAG: endo alpha-1,4 polygalactosaminidase [Actinomycetota bacterium]
MRAPRAVTRATTFFLLLTMFSAAPFAVTHASAAPVACKTTKGACWKPATTSLPWQYQLQSTLKAGCLYPTTNYINTGIKTTAWNGAINVVPKVFDIDIYQDPGCSGGVANIRNKNAVAAIHANGAHAMGYINAGSIENFRTDYPQYVSFDSSCNGCLIGSTYFGYRNEHWLSISDDGSVTGINPNTGVRETPARFIRNELTLRMADARADAFDAIEFDNVESYTNKNGFHTTAAQQLAFNESIANRAHSLGFTVALKNDLGQATDLQPYFDFAVSEQCFQYSECGTPAPGLRAWPSTYGKAVFNVEYAGKLRNFCPLANRPSYNFNSIQKDANLYDTPWTPCRG